MYFAYFQNLSIKIQQIHENYRKLIGTYENYISKCPDISENKAPILAPTVLLNKSY